MTFSPAMLCHRAIRGDFRWEATGTDAEDEDRGSGRTASPEAAQAGHFSPSDLQHLSVQFSAHSLIEYRVSSVLFPSAQSKARGLWLPAGEVFLIVGFRLGSIMVGQKVGLFAGMKISPS